MDEDFPTRDMPGEWDEADEDDKKFFEEEAKRLHRKKK